MPPSKKNSTPTMRKAAKEAVSRAIVVYDKNQNKQNNPSAPAQKPKKKKKKKDESMKVASVPASIGTSMMSQKPTVTSSGGVVRVRGREFVVTCPENTQTNWYLSAVFPVHPAYFKSTVLGNYARSYQKFRFNGGGVHFITRQPSSATGEVLMFHKKDVLDVSPGYNNSDFLSVALSMENALLGPIWTNHTLRIPAVRSEGDVNPTVDPDINDNIKGEVYVLTQSGITDNAGFLVFDYDFSFWDPMFTMHSSSIPIFTGPTDIKSFQDNANMLLNAQMSINCDSEYNTASNGTVFRIIINSTATTYAAGATSANALRIVQGAGNTTLAIQDGTTLYGTVVGSTLNIYPTLVSAKTISNDVFVAYNQTLGAKSTWVFNSYLVQIGNAITVNQN